MPGPVMPRSFPPPWLHLSLSHTGLGTPSGSKGEGKYSKHLESVFPLSHSKNTFTDTCSEQQGKGAEGVSSGVIRTFPLALAMALGHLSLSGSPIMGSAQYYFSYNLKYSRSSRSTGRMTAVRTELKNRKQQGTETTADGLIKITVFKYIHFKIS